MQGDLDQLGEFGRLYVGQFDGHAVQAAQIAYSVLGGGVFLEGHACLLQPFFQFGGEYQSRLRDGAFDGEGVLPFGNGAADHVVVLPWNGVDVGVVGVDVGGAYFVFELEQAYRRFGAAHLGESAVLVRRREGDRVPVVFVVEGMRAARVVVARVGHGGRAGHHFGVEEVLVHDDGAFYALDACILDGLSPLGQEAFVLCRKTRAAQGRITAAYDEQVSLEYAVGDGSAVRQVGAEAILGRKYFQRRGAGQRLLRAGGHQHCFRLMGHLVGVRTSGFKRHKSDRSTLEGGVVQKAVECGLPFGVLCVEGCAHSGQYCR